MSRNNLQASCNSRASSQFISRASSRAGSHFISRASSRASSHFITQASSRASDDRKVEAGNDDASNERAVRTDDRGHVHCWSNNDCEHLRLTSPERMWTRKASMSAVASVGRRSASLTRTATCDEHSYVSTRHVLKRTSNPT